MTEKYARITNHSATLSRKWIGKRFKPVCIMWSLIVVVAVFLIVYANGIDGQRRTDQITKNIEQGEDKEITMPMMQVLNKPIDIATTESSSPEHTQLPPGGQGRGRGSQPNNTKHELLTLKLYLEAANNASNNDTQDDLNANCSHRLGPSPVDDLAKIESYKFEGIQQYIDDLFPPMTSEPIIPELPVFVTAFSSNHYHEGLSLFKDIQELVRPKYKNLKVIFYDIGLSLEQVQSLNASCSCEIRIFQFDKYPKHVRNLQNYAWKTIAIQVYRCAITAVECTGCTINLKIVQTLMRQLMQELSHLGIHYLQLVAREYPFVSWMDTSVRWKMNDLDDLFAAARRTWLMVHDIGNALTSTLSEHTIKPTFDFLKENPCTFGTHGDKHATYIFIVANQFMTKYFLRPWVSCGLSFGCMDPVPNSAQYLPCGPPNKTPFRYHLCHRFDQSMLGILYARLFHWDLMRHAIDTKYFMFCRSTVKSERSCYLF